jgi:uroporphyrinogen III methyltransferase/synthase
MSRDKPLAGRRIVITRAPEQAQEFKRRLENLGAEVLLLPVVRFSAPADTAALDRAIGSLETFDWVVFTSANAARFFADRCAKLGRMRGAGGGLRYAAVGSATAAAAKQAGFTVDLVAGEFRGETLVRDLGPAIAEKRVLLPRSDRAGRELPDALEKAGAHVTEVIAYHTGGSGAADPGVIESVRAAQVDVVSFFSPSAVENLRGLVGTEAFSRLGARAAMAAVGPVTAEALRRAGVTVAIEAIEATAESVADAIAKYFSSRAAPQVRSL